jgi:hypothetical protein
VDAAGARAQLNSTNPTRIFSGKPHSECEPDAAATICKMQVVAQFHSTLNPNINMPAETLIEMWVTIAHKVNTETKYDKCREDIHEEILHLFNESLKGHK